MFLKKLIIAQSAALIVVELLPLSRRDKIEAWVHESLAIKNILKKATLYIIAVSCIWLMVNYPIATAGVILFPLFILVDLAVTVGMWAILARGRIYLSLLLLPIVYYALLYGFAFLSDSIGSSNMGYALYPLDWTVQQLKQTPLGFITPSFSTDMFYPTLEQKVDYWVRDVRDSMPFLYYTNPLYIFSSSLNLSSTIVLFFIQILWFVSGFLLLQLALHAIFLPIYHVSKWVKEKNGLEQKQIPLMAIILGLIVLIWELFE